MGNSLKKQYESNEKKQYFSYMKQVKSNYFHSILDNNNNNRIALLKKDFVKIRQVKINTNNNPQKIIKDEDWLYYIYKYFRNKVKEGKNDSIWYKNIIDAIYEKDYLYEIQYQSYAFYKDFEMKYKSKCLRNLDEDKEFEEKDSEEELISLIKRNSMVDLNRNSKIDLSGFTDNYGGSFMDFKDDPELYEEDNGMKTKKKLKKFIKILKKELNKENHPINIIISIFCKEFSKILENQLNVFQNMKNKNDPSLEERIKSFSDMIIDDLQRFIIKIQTITKLFYCKCINLDFFIEEKDELINLVTTIIFLKSNIHQNIYSLFEMQFKKEVNDFQYKLLLVKDVKPMDLNIPNKLSLDENTSKEILKFKEEHMKADEKEIFKSTKEFIPEDGYIKNFHKKNKIDGYNTVIIMIHGLKHTKTPFEKMMLIASMSTEITQCIDTYWNDMDNYLPNYYLSINADEFLSLYILVVIKAQFPELIIHEKIIQYFTTKATKSSTIGYYNVTLNAAIEYIQKEAIKELKNENYTQRLKNGPQLISKYLFLNSNDIDKSDEFILIDNQGKNINYNTNIINTDSNKNNFIGHVRKFSSKIKFKNIFSTEEKKDEKNLELSIKNSDDN